jgi:hypothetical protein
MVPADAVVQTMSSGLGFERAELLDRATFKDSSTCIVVPTRGAVHHRVVSAWQSLIAPMNQKRAFFLVSGAEVGDAYNTAIQNILANPELSTWKYVLTLEDDNLPPPDAHVRLLESIDKGYDAVSGIYFTKGEINMPMAYGNPQRFAETGALDFRPLDIREELKAEALVPVNGIAMGCSLYRMDLFREIPPPWFVTLADLIPGEGVKCYTQDLQFCEKAVRAGKKFAVDCRVKVGHLDLATGIVY